MLNHLLTCTGTAVARRRALVVETLAPILRNASQVIVADAHLHGPALELVELAMGCRAYLIGSEHQPAAGRPLHVGDRGEALGHLAIALRGRQRCWIWTAVQRSTASTVAASTLADWVARHWPGARVLVIDAETIADSESDAARFGSDPNGIAARYDVVVCTPALTSGVSITLQDHFRQVVLFSGGNVPPEDVAQAAGRLRTDAPRTLAAPDRAPGAALRMGSGSGDPDRVETSLRRAEAVLLDQLRRMDAALGQAVRGVWERYWCLLASIRNRQRHAYRATIVGLLEAEGYRPQGIPNAAEAAGIGGGEARDLAEVRELIREGARECVAQAEAITPQQAQELQAKGRLEPVEQAKLQRFELLERWGLEGQRVSGKRAGKLLEAEANNLGQRLLRRWLITEAPAEAIDAHDRRIGRRATSGGLYLAPDLLRGAWWPLVKAAQAIGVPAWLERRGIFGIDDPELQALHGLLELHRDDVVQNLGIEPCKSPRETLDRLLRPFGYRVASSRHGQQFRVTAVSLPAGVAWEAFTAAQLKKVSRPPDPFQQKGSCPVSPYSNPYREEQGKNPCGNWHLGVENKNPSVSARTVPVETGAGVKQAPPPFPPGQGESPSVAPAQPPVAARPAPAAAPHRPGQATSVPPVGAVVAVFHPITGWRDGWTVTGPPDPEGRVPLGQAGRSQWVSTRRLRPAGSGPAAEAAA